MQRAEERQLKPGQNVLSLLLLRLFEIVMCSYLKLTVEAVQVKQKRNHDKKITI